jgi:hypothetical protein
VSDVIRPFTVGTGALISTNVTETVAAWSPGVNYGVVQTVNRANRIYMSLLSDNLGKDPASNPFDEDDNPYWKDIGPNNAWSMFDNANRTRSTRDGDIEVVLQTTGYVDRIALFNLQASSARVVARKNGTVVYDRQISLLNNNVVDSWGTYFFEPVVLRRKVIFRDIPLIGSLRFTVTVSGGSVGVGSLIPGRSRFIGEAEYGANLRIKDYSRADFDEFGNYDPKQRPSSQGGAFDLYIDSSKTEAVTDLLTELRTVPLVWDMTPEPRGLLFGKLNSFVPTWSYPTIDKCSLDIEGLT